MERGLQETQRSLDHKARALPLNGCLPESRLVKKLSTHGSDNEPRDTCSNRSKILLIRGRYFAEFGREGADAVQVVWG